MPACHCCRQLSTHARSQGVDLSVTVCLLLLCACVFVQLRITPPTIKLRTSNFSRRLIGIQGRESHILANFAPPEAKNRLANQPVCTLNCKLKLEGA